MGMYHSKDSYGHFLIQFLMLHYSMCTSVWVDWALVHTVLGNQFVWITPGCIRILDFLCGLEQIIPHLGKHSPFVIKRRYELCFCGSSFVIIYEKKHLEILFEMCISLHCSWSNSPYEIDDKNRFFFKKIGIFIFLVLFWI